MDGQKLNWRENDENVFDLILVIKLIVICCIYKNVNPRNYGIYIFFRNILCIMV